MSLPVLPPPLSAPGFRTEGKRNISCTREAEVLSKREKTLYTAFDPSNSQLLFTQFLHALFFYVNWPL